MPSLSLGAGGAHTEIEQPFIGVDGVWREVSNGFVGVDGVWREFYTAYTIFTAAASPANINASFAQIDPQVPIWIGTSASAVVSTNDPSPPYAYNWVKVSGSALITAVSQNTAATTFQYQSTAPIDAFAIYACDVNDGVETVRTNTVRIDFS